LHILKRSAIVAKHRWVGAIEGHGFGFLHIQRQLMRLIIIIHYFKESVGLLAIRLVIRLVMFLQLHTRILRQSLGNRGKPRLLLGLLERSQDMSSSAMPAPFLEIQLEMEYARKPRLSTWITRNALVTVWPGNACHLTRNAASHEIFLFHAINSNELAMCYRRFSCHALLASVPSLVMLATFPEIQLVMKWLKL